MVPPSSVKITRVPTYLICDLCCFVYGAITLSCRTFQSVPLQHKPSADPLSLAATQGISIDFSSYRYLDVSVPCVCFNTLCIQILIPDKSGGFPHSEILGSKLAYCSPRHIVVCHVLLRLQMPRHSPYALNNLTTNLIFLIHFNLLILKLASLFFSIKSLILRIF